MKDLFRRQVHAPTDCILGHVCVVHLWEECSCIGIDESAYRTRSWARDLLFESGYRPLMICCNDSIVLGTFVELGP